jgi:hypothetical protein
MKKINLVIIYKKAPGQDSIGTGGQNSIGANSRGESAGHGIGR